MESKTLKLIPEFPGYYISKNGQVYSVSNKRHKEGIFLSHTKLKSGHLKIALCKNGEHYQKYIHRLVLETFTGQCPPGMEACHNNGNPQDNKLDNLRWDTPKNNTKDSIIQGTHSSLRRGEKHNSTKLTEKDVKLIRELYKLKKFNQYQLAKRFNICQYNISKIIRKETWKHI